MHTRYESHVAMTAPFQHMRIFIYLHLYYLSNIWCNNWILYLDLKCNKSLRIHQTNHLNLKMNYIVRVANCCKHWFHLILYIEMFRINPLKFRYLWYCMLHARYLIYILIHNKLKKSKLISNIIQIETDIL